MPRTRCRRCGRYLDGLTEGAERHPIFDTLCVGCGAHGDDLGPWTPGDQRRREENLYPETRV